MQIVVTINFGKLPPGKQKDETLDGNSFRTCCIKLLLNILSYVSYSDVSTVDIRMYLRSYSDVSTVVFGCIYGRCPSRAVLDVGARSKRLHDTSSHTIVARMYRCSIFG